MELWQQLRHMTGLVTMLRKQWEPKGSLADVISVLSDPAPFPPAANAW